MEIIRKEVNFDYYCEKCKHDDLYDNLDPCNECLETFMNENSGKPVYFEEADKK